LAVAAAGGAASAQALPGSVIYSCVDARGQRITSDRPNMECLDREQKQYGSSGIVRGRLAPSLTGDERAAEEERVRKAEEDRARDIERRRRDRVLLNRYPDEASHRSERDDALSRVDSAIATGERRVTDLQQQREQLARDEKAAGTDVIQQNRTRRAIDENEQNLAAQKRLLAAQAEERQRITRRFDDELGRLKSLWAQNAAGLPANGASRPRR
jgi:chromosome segregation ATPase